MKILNIAILCLACTMSLTARSEGLTRDGLQTIASQIPKGRALWTYIAVRPDQVKNVRAKLISLLIKDKVSDGDADKQTRPFSFAGVSYFCVPLEADEMLAWAEDPVVTAINVSSTDIELYHINFPLEPMPKINEGLRDVLVLIAPTKAFRATLLLTQSFDSLPESSKQAIQSAAKVLDSVGGGTGLLIETTPEGVKILTAIPEVKTLGAQ